MDELTRAVVGATLAARGHAVVYVPADAPLAVQLRAARAAGAAMAVAGYQPRAHRSLFSDLDHATGFAPVRASRWNLTYRGEGFGDAPAGIDPPEVAEVTAAAIAALASAYSDMQALAGQVMAAYGEHVASSWATARLLHTLAEAVPTPPLVSSDSAAGAPLAGRKAMDAAHVAAGIPYVLLPGAGATMSSITLQTYAAGLPTAGATAAAGTGGPSVAGSATVAGLPAAPATRGSGTGKSVRAGEPVVIMAHVDCTLLTLVAPGAGDTCLRAGDKLANGDFVAPATAACNAPSQYCPRHHRREVTPSARVCGLVAQEIVPPPWLGGGSGEAEAGDDGGGGSGCAAPAPPAEESFPCRCAALEAAEPIVIMSGWLLHTALGCHDFAAYAASTPHEVVVPAPSTRASVVLRYLPQDRAEVNLHRLLAVEALLARAGDSADTVPRVTSCRTVDCSVCYAELAARHYPMLLGSAADDGVGDGLGAHASAADGAGAGGRVDSAAPQIERTALRDGVLASNPSRACVRRFRIMSESVNAIGASSYYSTSETLAAVEGLDASARVRRGFDQYSPITLPETAGLLGAGAAAVAGMDEHAAVDWVRLLRVDACGGGKA